ncbi:MAG TPA: hypothetical protein VIV35_01505 [Chitinophagaceae bacterium]
MEDKEMKEFSLTAFFLVTGFSSFAFSKILQLLDGTQIPAFTWIGIIAILAGSLNSIRSLMQSSSE